MGIINTLKQQERQQGIFAVVAGARTSGKSTIAGTLKGKTLMLQAALLETGSNSAAALAKELGNDLTVITFDSADQLIELMQDEDMAGFDNVYIDGLSALTDLIFKEPAIVKSTKKNTWDGFRDLWIVANDVLMVAKELSFTTNVFFSLAVKEKYDQTGLLIAVEPETKGNATIGSIQKLCPTILYTVASHYVDDEDKNVVERSIITGYQGVYAGRIDSLLDSQNPGVMPADLSKIVDLIKGN